MQTIRLLIAYDGGGYHGWQIQKEENTIQGVLETAVSKITEERTTILGASRTDAGVHAFGQVAAFRTRASLKPDIFKRALNATLPLDIRVLKARRVSESFNPRKDAVKKRYSYFIENQPEASVFLHEYCWNIRKPLDFHAMRKAAPPLRGKHIFSSFMGTGSGVKNMTREIYLLRIKMIKELQFMHLQHTGTYIQITIEADGFLRHMVRNIVGTLVEIGRGRIPSASVPHILEGHDRKKAGPTAPACGLFLEKVMY